MPTCPKCTAPIAPEARFCTECGAAAPLCALPSAADASNPCSDEAHTALAAANLLKLRGEWQQAIDKCMQVLALDADNAAAHSILGDIYRDQGRVTEAVHWYKMALDLNPDSTADHIKLEQIIAQDRIGRAARRDRKSEVIGTAKRVIAEAALAIGLLLLLTTVWPVIFKPEPGAGGAQDKVGRPIQTRQRVRIPITIDEPAQPQQKSPGTPAVEPASTHEDALVQALNAAPAISQRGLRVKSIVIDPRHWPAVVTIVCPQNDREPVAHAILRSSLIVLREACIKDTNLERFTVRVLYTGPGGSPTQIQLIADAQRDSIMSANPEAAEYTQLVGVVQNPWWAQGVK